MRASESGKTPAQIGYMQLICNIEFGIAKNYANRFVLHFSALGCCHKCTLINLPCNLYLNSDIFKPGVSSCMG